MLQGKPKFIQDMATSMIPKLRTALVDWKVVEGTTIAQLLDPGLKDTLLTGDEKANARKTFAAFFNKYAGQQTSSNPATPKSVGSSIRDTMIENLRTGMATTVLEYEEYLNTATVPNVPVLSWWKGASQFPVHQGMAMDF